MIRCVKTMKCKYRQNMSCLILYVKHSSLDVNSINLYDLVVASHNNNKALNITSHVIVKYSIKVTVMDSLAHSSARISGKIKKQIPIYKIVLLYNYVKLTLLTVFYTDIIN